ncbi:diguanylate cyclase domain-containing protein [Sulfurimonas sp.]
MKKYNHNTNSYKKLLKSPYYLIALMSVIIIFITCISMYRLYEIGFDQQKKRLTEVVKSQSSMISMIFEYESYDHSIASVKELKEEVLDGLMNAHKQFSGFGKSGEYTLAKLENGKIHFLLRHRHNEVDRMNSVPFENSKLAEPMRKALKGFSGAFIGLDYRGKEVLAAYTPIKNIDWGVVAKIDLSEIQEPYIKETINAIIGAIVLIFFGSILIIKLTKPFIDEIENARRYNRLLFDKSQIGLALTDINGNMVDINPAFSKLIGYKLDELSELTYWDITPVKYKLQEKEQFDNLMTKGSYGPYDKEYVHKDGHLFNVRLSGSLLNINGESLIWSSVEDITEHKKNEFALKEASLVFEHTHEGIIITDADTNIIRINKTFTSITGYTFEDVKDKTPSLLNSKAHDEKFYKDIWEIINKDGMWCGELNNRRKNGEYFTTLQSITAVKNEKDEVIGYVSVFSDITERKNYENNLSYLVSHDNLTSLPNRLHFNDNLQKAIHMAKRNRYKLAVLFLDLNKFKEVNDTLGHDIGDELLKEVAKRFKDSIREEDTVARLGGDEFAIILNDIKTNEDSINISKKIIKKVQEPFNIKSHTLIPSTSIGISIYPDHGDSAETLLKLADEAMYVAKKKEKDNYNFYLLN